MSLVQKLKISAQTKNVNSEGLNHPPPPKKKQKKLNSNTVEVPHLIASSPHNTTIHSFSGFTSLVIALELNYFPEWNCQC